MHGLFNIFVVHYYFSASGTTDIILVYLDEKYPAVVFWDGNRTYGQGFRQRPSCPMDVAHYPFDRQKCNIIIGSWTHNSRFLNIKPTEIRIFDSTYHNHKWDLLDITSRVNLQLYNCCLSAPFSDIIYTLSVKRKPLFIVINVLLPSIMLMIMGNLAILLPPESGERISLGLTTFPSFTVFQLMVASFAPVSSLSVTVISKL